MDDNANGLDADILPADAKCPDPSRWAQRGKRRGPLRNLRLSQGAMLLNAARQACWTATVLSARLRSVGERCA
jgi:hypothetical protein